MNKAFNKYKKAKWINTRLSKKHKARQFIKMARASSIIAIAAAQVSLIKSSCGLDKFSKGLAIARCLTDTRAAVLRLYNKE